MNLPCLIPTGKYRRSQSAPAEVARKQCSRISRISPSFCRTNRPFRHTLQRSAPPFIQFNPEKSKLDRNARNTVPADRFHRTFTCLVLQVSKYGMDRRLLQTENYRLDPERDLCMSIRWSRSPWVAKMLLIAVLASPLNEDPLRAGPRPQSRQPQRSSRSRTCQHRLRVRMQTRVGREPCKCKMERSSGFSLRLKAGPTERKSSRGPLLALQRTRR